MAKVIYKTVGEYEAANWDKLLDDASIDLDNQGQVVIYTNIFFWKSDGTYRDAPEPEDKEPATIRDPKQAHEEYLDNIVESLNPNRRIKGMSNG